MLVGVERSGHAWGPGATVMCDTFVAVGSATADGALVFGKNSDRPADEEQRPIHRPARRHPAGARVRCTYVEIPEAAETCAVLLSQPTWMWGAEMGVNENGVVIGNEAVFTKAPLGPPALLGMDLVRLGLERGTTARGALEAITSLLEAHGQGGPCAEGDPNFQYHNSFLIADAGEAWVLDTADRHWAAQRVTDGVCNISNQLSVRRDSTLASEGPSGHAWEAGRPGGESPLDFAAAFGWEEPDGARPIREAHGGQLLARGRGRITPEIMMEILRDHDGGICMHGASRTTASLVCHVGRDAAPRIWMTWGDNPCETEYREMAAPALAEPADRRVPSRSARHA